jgi:hypothetical protein
MLQYGFSYMRRLMLEKNDFAIRATMVSIDVTAGKSVIVGAAEDKGVVPSRV